MRSSSVRQSSSLKQQFWGTLAGAVRAKSRPIKGPDYANSEDKYGERAMEVFDKIDDTRQNVCQVLSRRGRQASGRFVA